MDVRRKACRRVEKEYIRFKRKLIYQGSKEEIWEACGKIHFFECMKEYFALNEWIPRGYLELAVTEPEFLERAWRLYLREEQLQYRTWAEIDELLEALLMRWRIPLAG